MPEEKKDIRETPLRQVGSLTLNIDQESMKKVVADGRLLEFAGKVANEAAAQISAQIVDKLAAVAVGGQAAGSVQVGATFIFEGGDFATVPPRPKWGIFQRDVVSEGLLRQIAGTETIR
jgi:hypothetical protein